MTQEKVNVEVFDRDAAAGGYLYAQGDRLSCRLSNERMTRAILAAADLAGRRVVDLGCGDGTYTVELMRRGGASEVMGVDPAAAAVKRASLQAREAGLSGCHYAVGSVYDLSPFGRFDVAVLRGVLHHLSDPAAAVGAALAIASTVVILEPNGLNPLLKLIEKVSPYHRAHEEQSFLPARVDSWIRRSGGRIVGSSFINLVPVFCPDVVARICNSLAPAVEATPMIRQLACGQYVVCGRRE